MMLARHLSMAALAYNMRSGGTEQQVIDCLFVFSLSLSSVYCFLVSTPVGLGQRLPVLA